MRQGPGGRKRLHERKRGGGKRGRFEDRKNMTRNENKYRKGRKEKPDTRKGGRRGRKKGWNEGKALEKKDVHKTGREEKKKKTKEQEKS